MKSNEIAIKYGIDNLTVKEFIKKNATFKFTETFVGDIIIPDNVNIETFFYPLIAPKIEQEKS